MTHTQDTRPVWRPRRPSGMGETQPLYRVPDDFDDLEVELVDDRPTCRGDVLEEPLPANSDAGHKVVVYAHGSRSSYRGLRGMPGGELVLVVEDGEPVGPLPHHVKHSPGGFSWGYAGSGPAELARCLLIHALELDNPEDVSPARYQAFKFDVIARLPIDEEWELTRDEIRAWAAAHPAEEADR